MYNTIIAYEDLVGGAGEYKIALAGISYDENIKKANALIKTYEELLTTTKDLTEADRKRYQASLELAKTSKASLEKKNEYDTKITALDDYKKRYDIVMADVASKEAANEVLVKEASVDLYRGGKCFHRFAERSKCGIT